MVGGGVCAHLEPNTPPASPFPFSAPSTLSLKPIGGLDVLRSQSLQCWWLMWKTHQLVTNLAEFQTPTLFGCDHGFNHGTFK